MGIKIITSPSVEPVSVAELKIWARIDDPLDSATKTANDALLAAMISSAREQAETFTRRSFLTTVLELSRSGFPLDGGALELPRPPLASVASVTYTDLEDVSQTVQSSDYSIEILSDSLPAILVPDTVWPIAKYAQAAVRVRYTAGWPAAAYVPENIKTWIKIKAATLYANREAMLTGNGAIVSELPNRFVDGLLDRWCIAEVA